MGGVRAGSLGLLLGESPVMQALRARVARLGPSAAPVLIEGETGTGKELLARAIHEASPRRHAAFVAVNCGALSAELIDSELFGHERGAFTGAIARRGGRAAEAAGGTLFLDEVGELAPGAQCKVLRLLQEGEVQRLGCDRPLTVDVRVVAATNRDLGALVARGGFRADCYYRLGGFTLRVPPLRDRAGDVPAIAVALAARSARELGRAVPCLRADAAEALGRHRWPGNVRELENVVRELVLDAEAGVVTGADVRRVLAGRAAPAPAAALDLAAVLAAAGGNVTEAARALGVSRPTVYRWMRRRGLDWTRYRPAWAVPAARASA